ncbi:MULTISPECIES: NAD(P)-dependent oxidoreductase [unclassified Brevibacterium]|uniref:NAD(P)-dependent oxidoreductase n=1 Tax=unclassified Brevibacterium TaxID=2614124 RepID=UPI0010F43285|nr:MULTISPECIES: NAD(P)-dependent oxidoreductase [unclassified Brevibacterium]MCM1013073.1 NAD(P)-dependent oxidoreductase [Brevibacterium sp. XM4083]
MSEHVTFLGLGAIGLPMALRLHDAGLSVTGVDPFPDPRSRAAAGGLPAEAQPQSAARADTVIVMVADGAQLEAALTGDPSADTPGLLDLMADGSVLIIMSTVGPAAVRTAADRAAHQDISVLDVPVTGGIAGVRSGTLRLLASGPPAVLDSRRPVLEALGTIIDCGERIGDGQAFKIVNQLLCAVHIVAAAEALSLADRLGLDEESVLAAMTAGAGQSWMLGDRGPRMLEGLDAPVASAVSIFVKDTTLVAEVAAGFDIDLALLPVAGRKFAEAADAGLARRDDSQVIRTYDR